MDVDTIIGIDPGRTGAIAIKFRNQYKVHKMPGSLVTIDEMLKFYKEMGTLFVVIEQIRLHHSENMAQVSRMQKLFANYEQLKTLLTMNEITFVEVGPRSWQSFLGLNTKRTKAMKRDQRKKAYRDFAQAHWPTKLPIPLGDAVCLMIYGERNLKYNTEFGVISKGVQKLI